MKIIDTLKNFLFEDSVQETVFDIPDGDIFCESMNTIWQYTYALSVVTQLLSSYLTNIEWQTYDHQGKRVKKEDDFVLNYAPNNKESASEFFSKLAYQLINYREALIIQLANKELFVASSYNFLNGVEKQLKDNTFTNVIIGDSGVPLNRTFKENHSCIYIKLAKNPNIENIFVTMENEYALIKDLVYKGARKAMGMKLELKLTANAKNKYDDDYLRAMNVAYSRLMEKENSLFITYNGEQLIDLTEKQRGSEVQQVIDLASNYITINQEILINVGRAFGISKDIIMGDISTENEDNFTMTITNFAKPIVKLLSEKFSLFLLEKQSIIDGAKIIGNLDTIKFIDVISKANAIDKLIGSGAYTINELREKIGDNSVKDGDTRFITKNYSTLAEYAKEGGNNEN